MLGYDRKVPRSLKNLQEWFSSIIVRPLGDNSVMNPISPKGSPMELESTSYISPSPTLKSHERIQIYNQQYWWRLLSTLHETFPLATRLLGYYEFNQKVGYPCVEKYCPDDWSLNHFGDKLPKWVKEDYQGPHKLLMEGAVDVDYAYNECFFAGELKPIDLMAAAKEEGDSTAFSKKIYLQSHVFLFEFPYHFFLFREKMLEKDPDYWVKRKLPKLSKDKQHYFVLYRNQYLNISWAEVNQYEYQLLKRFKEGDTIENVCEWLEAQDVKFVEAASEKLHLWFQSWTIHRWLGMKS